MKNLLLFLLVVPMVSFGQTKIGYGKQTSSYDVTVRDNSLAPAAQNNIELFPQKDLLIPYHSEWTKNHYKERIEVFKNDPLNFNEIVFIGNSITEGGKNWSEKFNIPNIRNRGIGGDVTDGVLERLDEIIFFKPKAVFILIGINDLFNIYYKKQVPSPEYVGNNILKIARTIKQNSPSTLIYVQTLLPTSKDFMKSNIEVVNKIIAADLPNDVFDIIDLNSFFSDDKGFLKKELTSDGTHLTEEGYALWVKIEKNIILSVHKTMPLN
jgi:lysophospholipase L1-like esterase|tara:strand:- start:1256 stop:2056 length:801 start_codon:yes stop_codon:yes gene_type:complete